MRKFVAGFIGLFAVMVFLTPATADVSNADPAVVIKNSGCVMLDGDGFFVFTANTHAVITSSGQGKISCKASGLANSSGRAVNYNFDNTGLLCGTLSDITAKWHESVSASGNGTLTCRTTAESTAASHHERGRAWRPRRFFLPSAKSQSELQPSTMEDESDLSGQRTVGLAVTIVTIAGL